MTVVDTDRIDMADISDERTLDMMFEWLEPVPEGFKVEIVEGTVHMSPQRDTTTAPRRPPMPSPVSPSTSSSTRTPEPGTCTPSRRKTSTAAC